MIRPALAIANARGIPGTAGALVLDARGSRVLLANYHVVFGGGAVVEDRVWALSPGSHDAPVCIGRARSGQIGRVSYADEIYFIDCALIELVDETQFPPWLRSTLMQLGTTDVGGAEPGMRVAKHGAATGTTEGLLVDIAYPDHPFIDGRTWDAPGQLLVESSDPELNFSSAGDSGAGLFDGDGRIIGLLWGSNAAGQGIACPIAPVLDHLGVSLFPALQPLRGYA